MGPLKFFSAKFLRRPFTLRFLNASLGRIFIFWAHFFWHNNLRIFADRSLAKTALLTCHQPVEKPLMKKDKQTNKQITALSHFRHKSHLFLSPSLHLSLGQFLSSNTSRSSFYPSTATSNHGSQICGS
jgi:hypothetical protein